MGCMRIIFCMFLYFASYAFGVNFDHHKPSIVFVHLGEKLPPYLPIAIKQARLFNTCNIALIANQKALEAQAKVFKQEGVISIACESLQRSLDHEFFLKNSTLDREFRKGFWLFASERFFYLAEMCSQYELKDVIHLESDVMLYENVEHLLPVLRRNYRGMAVPFDMDTRSIPSFVYIRDVKVLNHFVHFMAMKAKENLNDMSILSDFRKAFGEEKIDAIPIVMEEYIEKEPVNSENKELFCNQINRFHSVFDAAYLGQFLGGVDPRNENIVRGYVNPHCVISSAKLRFSWEKDLEHRRIPFVEYGGRKVKINNLHIHSKRLKEFYSVDILLPWKKRGSFLLLIIACGLAIEYFLMLWRIKRQRKNLSHISLDV